MRYWPATQAKIITVIEVTEAETTNFEAASWATQTTIRQQEEVSDTTASRGLGSDQAHSQNQHYYYLELARSTGHFKRFTTNLSTYSTGQSSAATRRQPPIELTTTARHSLGLDIEELQPQINATMRGHLHGSPKKLTLSLGRLLSFAEAIAMLNLHCRPQR